MSSRTPASSISASGGERSFASLLDIVKTELQLIDARSFTQESKDALRSFLAYEVSIMLSMVNSLPQEKKYLARNEINNAKFIISLLQLF